MALLMKIYPIPLLRQFNCHGLPATGSQ